MQAQEVGRMEAKNARMVPKSVQQKKLKLQRRQR